MPATPTAAIRRFGDVPLAPGLHGLLLTHGQGDGLGLTEHCHVARGLRLRRRRNQPEPETSDLRAHVTIVGHRTPSDRARECPRGAHRERRCIDCEVEHQAPLLPRGERSDGETHPTGRPHGLDTIGLRETPTRRQVEFGNRTLHHGVRGLLQLAPEEGPQLCAVAKEVVVATPRLGETGHVAFVVLDPRPQGKRGSPRGRRAHGPPQRHVQGFLPTRRICQT
jgi:hypothetical protein